MKCNICQQGERHQLEGGFYDYITRRPFEIWSCDHCGTKVTRGEVQGNFYGQAYYGSEEGKFSKLLEPIFNANHNRNANGFYKRFHPKTVLEVGCGRGYILSALKKVGCKVQGIESADAADWILNNPEVDVHGVRDGESWPVADESIDLVIIWHVFEHVSDPVEVLKEMKRVLAPGGTICISVPNIKSLQAGLQLSSWFHLDVPRHLYHFSIDGIEQMVDAQGMQIVERKAGDFLQNLYGWYQTFANMMTPANNNIVYRFLQGGEPWRSCKNKWLLVVHLLTAPLVVPPAVMGWLIETVSGRHGSMTLYVSKK